MELTKEDDRSLRNYAKYLDIELGEDAYHEVVCAILKSPPKDSIRNIKAFFISCIKRSVQKLRRHIQVEFLYTSAWVFDDRPPGWGPSTHDACKKGHPFTTETIVYKNKNRTCLLCKRVTDAKLARKYRERKKAIKMASE